MVCQAPTRTAIETQLISEEQFGEIGEASWLVSGIKLEESQLELGQAVRILGPVQTKSQAITIMDKRERLMRKLDRFHEQALNHIGLSAVELIIGVLEDPGDFQIPDGTAGEDIGTASLAAGAADVPEKVALHLPSRLSATQRALLGLESLALKELKI
jgi:hypothetical protein